MLISINRNLINKATPELIAKYNGTFENVNISAIDLANSVNEGFAFCSQHKEQRRKSSNFTGAGFLAIDIDHGLTLETVQADTYYKKYGTIIYTTPSHTADAHRFRIVFELETPILDAQKMTQALTGLISRFGADGSCKDACRLFFGSKNSAPIVSDNRLPTSEVDALVLRAQESYVR